MNNINFALFSFLFASSTIYAQEPPQMIKSLSQRSERIIPKGGLDGEQREYFWARTTENRRGYFEVDVPSEYVNILNRFSAMGRKSDSSHPYYKVLKEFDYTLKIIAREDENRCNYIFENSSLAKLMFTKWEYKNAGAEITLSEDFLNAEIAGVHGTLSLATTKGNSVGIWKLAWLKNGVSYELYISDRVDVYGIPQRTPDGVIRVGEKLMSLP